MGQLQVRFDTNRKVFIEATLDGEALPDLGFLALSTHVVKATDSRGQDLRDVLLAPTPRAEEPSPDQAKAAVDVVKAFGYVGDDVTLPDRSDRS